MPPVTGQSIPSFSQGKPAPAFLPRHRYGAGGTIHQTGELNVEIDPVTKEVTSVWFRCLNLPFTVFERPNTCRINPEHMAIEEITWVDLEVRDDS